MLFSLEWPHFSNFISHKCSSALTPSNQLSANMLKEILSFFHTIPVLWLALEFNINRTKQLIEPFNDNYITLLGSDKWLKIKQWLEGKNLSFSIFIVSNSLKPNGTNISNFFKYDRTLQQLYTFLKCHMKLLHVSCQNLVWTIARWLIKNENGNIQLQIRYIDSIILYMSGWMVHYR